MTKQSINIGSAANDSTGDPLRTAFTKINANFTELYANVGSSNYRFSNNTMSTVTGDMNIVPNGTSDVIIGSLNQLNVSATTSSVSTTTGALVVNGGVGIGGALWVGDDITTAGTLYAGTASFGAIDDTPIGDTTPSTGNFTTATINDLIVTDSIDSQGQVTFANLNVTQNTVISNFQSGNVNITGGNISGVILSGSTIQDITLTSVSDITGISLNNVVIGNTTPNTAVFTVMTTANAQITGGDISGVTITPSAINDAKIGNATPSTGAFTTLTASGATTFTNSTVSTSSITGGVVLSGGMGVAGNINAGANITAAIVSATSNGLGTNFKVGDDAWIGDINSTNTLRIMGQQDNTKGYIVFGNADTATLGRDGANALTYTGAFTATGNISAGNISADYITATEDGKIRTGYEGYLFYDDSSIVSVSGDIFINTAGGIVSALIVGAGGDITVAGSADVNNSITANSYTSKFGGQLTGYHTGAIGANTPNTGAFTSITTTNNVTINGILSVPNNDIVGNVTGNLTGVASSATTAGTATYASTAGLASTATTVVQPYQGNITGVGTLANITTTGNLVCANVYVNSNLFAYQDINVIGNINFLNTTGTLNYQQPLRLKPFTTTAVGIAGDLAGHVVYDSGNIYVCTADYDGVSVIWKRTALTSI